MKKPSTEKTVPTDVEEIARKASNGEDVSEFFTNQPVAKQRVNVDFPLEMVRAIDAECQAIGVTRQAWIKLACDERLRLLSRERIPKAS
jgi:hypothetical protein